MALTDVRIRQAKPAAKPYRLTDGGGLFLEVRPNGSKLWRYAYRLAGKANLYAVGRYPDMPLQDAREARTAARAVIREGRHPAHVRAAAVAATVAEGADTFGVIADRWVAANSGEWSAGYVDQVGRYLGKVLKPRIGRRPIRAVTSADMLAILESTATTRGPAAAAVVRRIASEVFAFAIVKLLADNDPTYPLRKSIKRPAPVHATAHGADQLRALASRLRAYGGNVTTRIAVELLALTFVRTAELRGAPWSEFDLDGGLWIIPAERMKKRRPHMIPLAPRAVELLRELQEITGRGALLFPNVRDAGKPMSRMTINRALEYMGFPPGVFTGHDFRATASTQLHEMGYRSEIVEMQLAHAKKDKSAAPYNHAKFLPERQAMMGAWADWLAGVAATAPEPAHRPRTRRQPMRRAG